MSEMVCLFLMERRRWVLEGGRGLMIVTIIVDVYLLVY